MKSKIENNQLAINTIRALAMDMVQKANSGHPGTAMALAPLAFTLYNNFMNFNPINANWANRDRFILSAGHASTLLYSVLHLMGYDVSMDDLKNFRQLHSKTAGHPEIGLMPGIEMTTGPLGQGIATSVGMAIAEKWLKNYFNRPGYDLIDYNIFAVAGDGCMMEGISHEAASYAGHLGLNNLIWIYDDNGITIEGDTNLTFSEDIIKRFDSYNWQVQTVSDVNDLDALNNVLTNAIAEKFKPSLIIVKSHIAYGSPNKQDSHHAHGEPLGVEEIKATKNNYGLDPKRHFYVPDEVKHLAKLKIANGKKLEKEWNELFEKYSDEYPELAKEFNQIQVQKLPVDCEKNLPQFPIDSIGTATRKSNHKILNYVARRIPWFLGGAADLMPSTKTGIDTETDFNRENCGRNFHFGIREHAMGAIVNGMALSKLRTFGATFLVFSDYMRASIRLAALMKIPSLFIFTHDSIGVGEDGPTHQPIEHLAALRAMPNLDVIRPADANELSVLWKQIIETKTRPSALILSRQAIPTIDRNKYKSAKNALKGGYILADSGGKPEIILLSTGSEVSICIEAYEKLITQNKKVRVVSLPCWSVFDQQPSEYREKVLPSDVKIKVAVEAGAASGWHKYIGNSNYSAVIGVARFGKSAPAKQVFEEFDITFEKIVDMVERCLKLHIRDLNFK